MKKILLLISFAATIYNGATAQTLVGLTTDGKIFEMAQAAMPGTASTPITITGVALGQTIVGIDYRPNTGELYALGYNELLPTANAQLYTINKSTGVATAVGAVISLTLGTGSIGFDFNPTVDRIRVVGQNRKNYRLHPTTGAIAATDTDLAYAGTDVNNGATAQIGACAYTNSYIGSEVTTLYDYDQNLNILATQIPPNNGTLNTIGSSGISVNSASASIGMDIYFDPATKMNIAYLNANTGTGTNDNLYTINLSTGATTMVGQIGGGIVVKDIAAVIDRTVPSTYTGQLVYGLTKNNRNLIKFSTDNPELIRELLPITGLTAGQVIVGMDIRPLDLGLYALGYNEMTRAYQLYSINTTTGAATAINTTPLTINLGMGQKIGFDFNPTVDRIRVVSTNDSNYRLNPITGALAATDTILTYNVTDGNTGKNPYVSTVAYTNSYKGTTGTTLFGIDDSLGVFTNVVPPNQGYLNTLGTNVVVFNLADLTNDMDFFYDSAASANIGYMAANIGASLNDNFYTITTAGVATLVKPIGLGVQVSDIAVQLTYTNTPAGIANVGRKAAFGIYPNPAGAELHVAFYTATATTTLVITDVTGRVVKTQAITAGSNNATVNVADLTNGVYTIGMADNTTKAVKFVKY